MRRLLIAIVMVMVSTLPVFLAGASYLQLNSDIGLTPIGLGAVTAAFFLTASVTSTPLGRLVERIGWRNAMRINLVVSALIMLMIPVVVESPGMLAALLVAAGLPYGFTNPAANLSLAELAPPERRGIVFGLKHAGIPSSTLVAGAAVPLLVTTVGWRPTYALTSIFALVAWVLIATEPERSHQREAGVAGEDVDGRLSTLQLVTMAIGAAFGTWAAVSLGSFLVAGSVEASLSESQAGVLLFLGSAASILARLVAGIIADRRNSAGFFGVSVMMAIGAIAFVLISGASGVSFALLIIASFAFGWGWPGLMTFSVVRANATSAASSSAITQAGVFLGAGVGPVVIGWVVDNWTFTEAWLVVAVFTAIAAVIVGLVGAQMRARQPSVNPTPG